MKSMSDPETMTRKCIDGVVTSDTDTGENVSGFSPSAYRVTEANQAQVVLMSVRNRTRSLVSGLRDGCSKCS